MNGLHHDEDKMVQRDMCVKVMEKNDIMQAHVLGHKMTDLVVICMHLHLGEGL